MPCQTWDVAGESAERPVGGPSLAGARRLVAACAQPDRASGRERLTLKGGGDRLEWPSPPIRELTYVTELEFLPDPGPAEPVWSGD
jgi:hypothetical protein